MAVVDICNASLPRIPLVFSLSIAIYVIGWIVYCRFFHPLARVPGPFLASITEFYRFYYNFIKSGRYYMKFDEFVEKYGEYSVALRGKKYPWLMLVKAQLFVSRPTTCSSPIPTTLTRSTP
jgi:hypothetical protein